MRIGIIGYGSVGKQLYNTLIETGTNQDDIFIFDDNLKPGMLPNVMSFNEFRNPSFIDLKFIPALGYLSKALKMQILNELIELKREMFTFIHPTAFVSRNAEIGRGVIVYPLCNIDQGVIIEDGTVILNSTIIAHDSTVGRCCYLAPGVCVSGFVNIEQLSFIGSGSVIANNIVIGEGATVAMATSVTKSIPKGSFAIGNPFQLKQHLTLV